MKTLEETTLNTLFNLIDYEKENFLEDGSEFENAGQLLDCLEQAFEDDDVFNDLGHIIIDWTQNNIEYVFTEYKKSLNK